MKKIRVHKLSIDGSFLTKWSTNGTGNGECGLPLGIDRDLSNNIYVVDQANSNVQKFTNNGTFVTKLSSKEFSKLEDIELDSQNNLYVTDRDRDMILKFSPQR